VNLGLVALDEDEGPAAIAGDEGVAGDGDGVGDFNNAVGAVVGEDKVPSLDVAADADGGMGAVVVEVGDGGDVGAGDAGGEAVGTVAPDDLRAVGEGGDGAGAAVGYDSPL
jgi:hypothetical protein